MRVLFAALVVVGLIVSVSIMTVFNVSSVHSQSAALAGQKENLDLPFDAGTFSGEEEDEDAPEVVNFYGQQFEGDGVFFAIDRSGSMQNSGELQIAKREVIKNITEFSSKVQFGIAFFDAGMMKFPTSGRPAESNPSMKGAALSWVNTVPGGGGSCCQRGLVQALKFANFATSQRRVVIYVGDGGGTCSGQNAETYLKQTLAVVKAQNYQKAQINAIGVLEVSTSGEQFLRSLSASNGGTYTKVNK